MGFKTRYVHLVKNLLGRMPTYEETCSEKQIEDVEKLLRLCLPLSLREYYLVAGKLIELNKSHNILLDVEVLYTKDVFLIFMEENQEVVYWGIKIDELTTSDPEVWQIINSEQLEYHSEEMPLSEFIVQMMEWQFGFRVEKELTNKIG